MQEHHDFEYAVIRIVPKVEREEFVNAGVILYCARKKFLGVRWNLDEDLLLQFAPDTDLALIKENLCAFDKISSSASDGGQIAALSLPERFRWLTAVRSTMIQTSPTHPGYTTDPQQTLDQLYARLVIR